MMMKVLSTSPTRLISSSSSTTRRLKLAKSVEKDTLKILEWAGLCNQLSPFTSTSMGLSAAQNASLPIGQTPLHSTHLLAQTSAALSITSPPDFSPIQDLTPFLHTALSAHSLSIPELSTVQRTLAGARYLLQHLEAVSDPSSPLLQILRKCDFLEELERKIDFCIDSTVFIVRDRASEDLEIIRFERKRNMEALESLLKQVSAQIFQAGGIDRPVVTKRRNRMCVAVRASHRSIVRNGVVLDTSNSGATYFVEPREAVEFNNMEVRLCSSEKIEEQAILSMLTKEISDSELEIRNIYEREVF